MFSGTYHETESSMHDYTPKTSICYVLVDLKTYLFTISSGNKMAWHIRGIIKNLVLAPSAGALAFIGTSVGASIAAGLGAITPAVASNYALAAFAAVFGVVVAIGVDEMVD